MKAELPGRALKLALGAFAASALLHVDRVPPWCGVVAVAALLWRFAHLRGLLPLPNFVMRLLLVMALTAATLATFRTLNGLAAGSALLMAMGAAKILESRQRRDAQVLVLTSLVLLLAACLDRQGLLRLPLYVTTGWISCAALVALGTHAQPAQPIRTAFGVAGRSLLWSLPFAAILFVLVPRLPGALWSLPGNEKAQTGLSEEMSPGSISELAVSDEVAFRVRFSGAVPPPHQRYWRGPVLHSFDGYTWTRGAMGGLTLEFEPLGEPVRYEVMLEPSSRNWWFGLDTVTGVSRRGVFLTYDGQLLSNRPVTSPTAYEAVSHLSLRTPGPLPLTTRRLDTRLPENRNPRSRQLALTLRAQARDESGFVVDTLDYFRTGGFEYTLTPPLLDYNSIDDLLFNTRLGFCGHFASAFVMLMRAGGVPARVVTGYQGGEWNPVSGYFIVRQSAAHAWAEVWIEGSGWQRVDPTAVVAPERLQRGLDDLLPDRRSNTDRLFQRNPLLRNLADVWDASNLWWQTRVVNFNEAVQLDLLRRIGLGNIDWRGLTWLLLGGTAAWAVLAAILIGRRPRSPDADAVGRTWQQFRALLRLRGLTVEPHEPPRALVRRAASGWPGAAEALESFSRSYLRRRYGPDTDRNQAGDLDRQLKRVRAAIGRSRPLDAFEDLGNVPLYRRLPVNLRLRVATLATEFLRRIRFEGCGGLVLTPHMRRVIAFQACVPILNRGAALYSGLRSVLVYPAEFVVAQETEDDAGVITRGDDVLSGQTEDTSRVLLSWTDIERGLQGPPRYNVVLHEFAHIIDHTLEGRLTRREGDADADWHEVMQAEYEALCAQVDGGAATLIDPYGAEDPVEFFAVCTETFFELPEQLATRHSRLYAALARLYRLDPAAWSHAAGVT